MKAEETRTDKSDIFGMHFKSINSFRNKLLNDEAGLAEIVERESREFFSKYKEAKISEKDKSDFMISLMNIYQEAFQKKHKLLDDTEKRLQKIKEEYTLVYNNNS